MRKFSTLLLLVVLVTSMFSTIHAANLIVSNNGIMMDLEVLNAYYTDYEGDGIENDVVAEYNLTILLDKDLNNVFHFIISTDLILPSGLNFYYEFDWYLPSSPSQSLLIYHFAIVFWNHALEAGWYALNTGIEIFQWGHQEAEILIIFDPPSNPTDGVPPPTIVHY